MKYSRFLSISIAFGILLAASSYNEQSKLCAATAGTGAPAKLLYAWIPAWRKYNPGSADVNGPAIPRIFVEFTKKVVAGVDAADISYWFTDSYNNEGQLYHFDTLLKFDNTLRVGTVLIPWGEVKLSGTSLKGSPVSWVSLVDPNDNNVTWIPH
jgi:hypothetical protein